MHVVTVAPVKHKFWQSLSSKIAADPGHVQNLKDLVAGLPGFIHPGRLRAVGETASKACPALTNKANETTVDFFGRPTFFAPVKNKLRSQGINELCVDTRASHDFHGVFTGLPINVEGGGCCYRKG